MGFMTMTTLIAVSYLETNVTKVRNTDIIEINVSQVICQWGAVYRKILALYVFLIARKIIAPLTFPKRM